VTTFGITLVAATEAIFHINPWSRALHPPNSNYLIISINYMVLHEACTEFRRNFDTTIWTV